MCKNDKTTSCANNCVLMGVEDESNTFFEKKINPGEYSTSFGYFDIANPKSM